MKSPGAPVPFSLPFPALPEKPTVRSRLADNPNPAVKSERPFPCRPATLRPYKQHETRFIWEEYFNGLLKEVDQRMATTAPGMDGKEVIGVCREMVSYLKGKNRELKEYALAHPFAGDAKEILYFKYYKPALTGRLLYYYRVYQIESGCPACLRVAEPYYRKAMERAERMMERYLPFYQYYHSGATYRDSYYFLRAKDELSPESGSFVLDEEAEFSTGYDILRHG